MNNTVYINKISTFLPNHPVSSDEMEKYIGYVNEKSAIAKRLILNKNGIKTRYYALDRDGNTTHTNVELAAQAVKGLEDSHFTINQMDLLACGTASPEQIMPSHGVMVHGELQGSPATEVVSFAGSCCTGMHALKYSYLSVLTGLSHHAVCVASERFSAWMTARYFEKEAELLQRLSAKPILAFEKEFLRWMLSDGASALLLEEKPSGNGPSFRVEWIEMVSYANETETCMYAGGEKNADGRLVGWAQYPETEWLNRSLFSLKQDTRILENNIVRLAAHFLKKLTVKRHFSPEEVWFLPHLSSMYFKGKIQEALVEMGYNVPDTQWYVNLPEVGNIASASAFVMLDGLARTGKLKTGDKILLVVPESARFSYAFALLTVC